MADVFISYAKKDRDWVFKLAAALAESGCTVWWDSELEHGTSFDRVIEREIEVAAAVVVVWSDASRESDWCRAEATAALDERKLVPISIQQARPPMRFANIHTGDFSNWNGGIKEEPFLMLCRDLVRHGIAFDKMPQLEDAEWRWKRRETRKRVVALLMVATFFAVLAFFGAL